MKWLHTDVPYMLLCPSVWTLGLPSFSSFPFVESSVCSFFLDDTRL